MRTRLLALLILLALLTAAACNDDGTTPQNEFQVIVEVVDFDGYPVPDLDLSLLNDHPWLQKAAGPDKAVTAIQFSVPREGHAEVTILNVEGSLVRTMVSDDLVAGEHRVMWNGADDEGSPLFSGRYTVRYTFQGAGDDDPTELSQDVLMAAWEGAPVGTTDANGRIFIKDRYHFPHLYDLEDMMGLDENGEFMGAIELSPTMLFQFYSRDEQRWQAFRHDVRGPGRIQITWAPPRARLESPAAPPRLTGVAPPPIEMRLRVYPNPFN